MNRDRDLQNLANDLWSTMFTTPKKKRLRPLVKQLTYKGRTVKWTFDGAGVKFVKGPTYDWNFARQGDETVEDFVKRMIDEGGV